MLGIFLIYFIGKSFYSLAGVHNRNEWGYAILAVVLFYIYQILVGLFYAILYVEDIENEYSTSEEMSLNLMGFLIGGVLIYFTYYFLQKKWESGSNRLDNDMDILDEDILDRM